MCLAAGYIFIAAHILFCKPLHRPSIRWMSCDILDTNAYIYSMEAQMIDSMPQNVTTLSGDFRHSESKLY